MCDPTVGHTWPQIVTNPCESHPLGRNYLDDDVF